MAGSVNRVILVGNLGADPEVKSFSNGGKVCNIRIATSETWKSKDGEKKEKVEWHSVAIFGDGLADVAGKYLRKGSKIYLEGKLSTRKWQDQAGNDRYTTEVVLQGPQAKLVFLSGNEGGSGGGSQQRQSNTSEWDSDDGGFSDDRRRNSMAGGGRQSDEFDDLNDDVPFISCCAGLDNRKRIWL